jgi:hypothetical protein
MKLNKQKLVANWSLLLITNDAPIPHLKYTHATYIYENF